MNACPNCGAAVDVSHRMSGDRVYHSACGQWFLVIYGDGYTLLATCDPPVSWPAKTRKDAATLAAYLECCRALDAKQWLKGTAAEIAADLDVLSALSQACLDAGWTTDEVRAAEQEFAPVPTHLVACLRRPDEGNSGHAP